MTRGNSKTPASRSVYGPDYPASTHSPRGLHRVENPKYGQDYGQYYNYAADNPYSYEEPYDNYCPPVPVSQIPQSPKASKKSISLFSKYWIFFVIIVGVIIIFLVVGTVVILKTKNNGISIATSTVGPVQTTSQPVPTTSQNAQTIEPREPCKNNFRLPSPESTKCWSIFDGFMTTSLIAKGACYLMSARLATVKNADEDQWMHDFMWGHDETWIGLQCNTPSDCQWGDGTQLEGGYTNFENGSSLFNTCTLFGSRGFWRSVPCDSTSPSYVCEMDRMDG